MPLSIDLAVEAGDWPAEGEFEALAALAIDAALAVSRPDLPRGAELSLLFTDDAAIRLLNARWRNQDKPTNVLSFPAAPGSPLLGDIVLSAETVAREAALAGVPPDHHIAHLIVHGFLHLLGYDHETDDEAGHMERLEAEALARIGIADPYAARLKER